MDTRDGEMDELAGYLQALGLDDEQVEAAVELASSIMYDKIAREC